MMVDVIMAILGQEVIHVIMVVMEYDVYNAFMRGICKLFNM